MINWLKQLFGIPEQKKSASIAKERLMVIVAHERGNHENQPDFLPLLQKELTAVIAKYVKIDANHVQVEFEQKGGRSVLELNVTLPDGEIKPQIQPQVRPVVATAPVVATPRKQVAPRRVPSKIGGPGRTGSAKRPVSRPGKPKE